MQERGDLKRSLQEGRYCPRFKHGQNARPWDQEGDRLECKAGRNKLSSFCYGEYRQGGATLRVQQGTRQRQEYQAYR